LKSALRAGLALAVCILFATVGWGANIVQNPGFETGDFTDWKMVGVQGVGITPQGLYNNVVNVSGATPWFVAVDNFGADLGDGGVNDTTGAQEYASLSQSWVGLDTSATYILTYYFANFQNPGNPAGLIKNYFEIFWNGNSLLNLTNTNYEVYTPAGSPLVLGGLSANGTSDKLEFRFYNTYDDFALDQVCVDSVPGEVCASGDNGEVPEPSTLALIGLPLIGLALARRRK
jgi:hypothetical protein